MATATTPSAPQYVQQAFNWDELETSPVITKPQAIPHPQTDAVSTTGNARKPKGQPLTVPTFSKSTSVRRGRCEHVGGILASVLEKYGIGVDQLLAEIEK